MTEAAPALDAPPPEALRGSPAAVFRRAIDGFGPGPTLVLGHDDADGLSASAILLRGIERAGRAAAIRTVRRGESPWSAEMAAEIEGRGPGGVIVADLGVRAEPVHAGPTLFIDHHVPRGAPPGAAIVSGFGAEPSPTTSLLAFRCMAGFAKVDDLLWLAALGIVGDMAEDAGFSEMAEARARYGVTALRKAAALVNQPRRSASGDPAPALALLLKAEGPKDVLSGAHPETALLLAARDEVRAAADAARRTPPRIAGDVALIRFASPCQVHPLVAQIWAGRLRGRIVLAANTGFRPGWVHFAARTAEDADLPAFLARHAPPEAGGEYGGGHRGASGGALRNRDWNPFVRSLGFGPEMEIEA